MKRTKEQKGITLIALIITIVVLMILAAVAINSITNEGILSQAGSTANKYNQAVKDEESYLQDYEDMLTAANGGYETYTVGTLVTVNGENFYVIEDKTSLGKVVLLAKGNINTTALTQTSANPVAFSTEPYWTGAGDIKEETFPIPESHIAAKAAYDYGLKIGGKGRLMTHTEANTLKDKYSDMIYGPTGAKLEYWLGSANSTDFVWLVDGDYGGLGDVSCLTDGHFVYDSIGVRPVIEISKSKLP